MLLISAYRQSSHPDTSKHWEAIYVSITIKFTRGGSEWAINTAEHRIPSDTMKNTVPANVSAVPLHGMLISARREQALRAHRTAAYIRQGSRNFFGISSLTLI